MDDAEFDTSFELERLSTAYITIANARDWSFESPEGKTLASRIAPEYSEITCAGCIGSDTVLERVRNKIVAFPFYFEELLGTSCEFDQEHGTAIVNMHVRAIVDMNATAIESIREVRWRRNYDGKWLVYRVVGIRGISVVPDQVADISSIARLSPDMVA